MLRLMKRQLAEMLRLMKRQLDFYPSCLVILLKVCIIVDATYVGFAFLGEALSFRLKAYIRRGVA